MMPQTIAMIPAVSTAAAILLNANSSIASTLLAGVPNPARRVARRGRRRRRGENPIFADNSNEMWNMPGVIFGELRGITPQRAVSYKL
jgi:hypothetical protein